MTGDNTLYMRAWTECFNDPIAGNTMGDFVRYFKKYEKWFAYRSWVARHWHIRWK